MTEEELLKQIDRFQHADYASEEEGDEAVDLMEAEEPEIVDVILEQKEIMEPAWLLKEARARRGQPPS